MIPDRTFDRDITVYKSFSKHLMEKSGLIIYANSPGKTMRLIEYDSDTGQGYLTVIAAHPDKSDGTEWENKLCAKEKITRKSMPSSRKR